MSENPSRRLAVVLFNLGGPDSLKAVRPFLFNLFRDPAIISLPGPARLLLAALIATTRRKEASRNYAHMGGASPLLKETLAQGDALQTCLNDLPDGLDARVFVAMRYWRPFTRDAARAVEAFRPDEVVLLPLYPQYSTTTTASSLSAWRRTYKGGGQVRTICCYFDSPGLVAAHVQRIRETYVKAGSPGNLRLLFSAHGLPQRVVDDGDPYQWQVERTCQAVAEALGPGWDWQVCYQSRVGPLKWLAPSTPEALVQAGQEGKGVLVAPIAFVSEHVETLVELDRDYAALAMSAGCSVYLRAPALGLAPIFIDALVDAVSKAVQRDGVSPQAGGCASGWAKCPHLNFQQANA